MDAATRVLVLANRTADSTQLQQLLPRHARGPIAVTMLAPAIWEVQDPHGGTESARRRLRAAQKHLQAGGIEASGMIGDPDPMTAVEREWQRGHDDEIILPTLPRYLSKWPHIDHPQDRARRRWHPHHAQPHRSPSTALVSHGLGERGRSRSTGAALRNGIFCPYRRYRTR